MKLITKKRYKELLDYKEKYKFLAGEKFTIYRSGRSKRSVLLQLSKEELVRMIFELSNYAIQLQKKLKECNDD